jgi:hypothetical protein
MSSNTNNVLPLSTVLQLEPEDAALAGEQASAVEALLTALGEEIERHEVAKALILARVQEARQSYGSTVRVLAKKYVKDKGQYTFKPDIGAFIGVKGEPADKA